MHICIRDVEFDYVTTIIQFEFRNCSDGEKFSFHCVLSTNTMNATCIVVSKRSSHGYQNITVVYQNVSRFINYLMPLSIIYHLSGVWLNYKYYCLFAEEGKHHFLFMQYEN
jgi:hypothetical protein